MNMKHIALSLALISLTACAGFERGDKTKADAPSAKPASYKIGVEDRVQVSVWRNPDLSVTVPVRPDGKISVPLIGDVAAAGLTPMEVSETVKNKLSYYIRDPNVSIIVTDLRSHEFLNRVRITGAVRNPQSIPYRQGMTVLDAVLQAGGVNDFAAPDRTKLHRKTQAKTEVISIKLGSLLSKGGVDSNIEVKPGDVIAVPERLF